MGHTRHPASRPAVRRHHRDRSPTTTVGEAPIAPGSGGDTDAGRDLQLPHEQDQRTGETDPQPTDVMRQAKDDIESGQVDTDMRATPGLDAAERERLVKGESGR